MNKVDIGKQIETMRAILVAEEYRQCAAVARGEATEQQAADYIARVQAVLSTIEWCAANAKDLKEFRQAQRAQAGR